MDIKKIIGKRIAESRKNRGWTVRQLSAHCQDLKPTRISNWEQGLRTPGPQETAILARALQVSPGFLMGFTEESQPSTRSCIPLLSFSMLTDDNTLVENICQGTMPLLETQTSVSIDTLNPLPHGQWQFALQLKDNSMSPQFNTKDVLIIAPQQKPQPGSCVLAQIDNQQIVCRKFAMVNTNQANDALEIKLLPLNPDWPTLFSSKHQITILGTVTEQRRYF